MKTKHWFAIILFSVFTFSCKTEEISLKLMDEIQSTKYYPIDIIEEMFQPIYGVWKVTGMSGGFSGMGYEKDFDYLIFKRNAIFGIVRNDSLINFGKLTLFSDDSLNPAKRLLCRFDFENNTRLDVVFDPEKYIEFAGFDTLNLMSPCCDRYNIHLVRQQTNEGTLKGKINIGPLCPVESIPPRPECLPTMETYRNWQTAIWNASKTKKIMDVIPELDGNFEIVLSEGSYLIDFDNKNTSGIGVDNLPLKFSIKGSETVFLDINIDTGIR